MFCRNCGTENAEEANFCEKCGDQLNAGKIGQSSNEIANPWKRLGARLIDGIILALIIMPISFVFGMSSFRMESIEDIAAVQRNFLILQGLAILITWFYYALQESSNKQATIGKKALGIKVADIDGNRLSFGRATGRHFAKIVSALTCYIGFIMILFTAKNQGLHDMIASTYVYEDRK